MTPVRSPRSVEALFPVRDVTFGEDACRGPGTGAAPTVLSAPRDAAITLPGRNALTNKAAARRGHAAHPEGASALVKGGSG